MATISFSLTKKNTLALLGFTIVFFLITGFSGVADAAPGDIDQALPNDGLRLVVAGINYDFGGYESNSLLYVPVGSTASVTLVSNNASSISTIEIRGYNQSNGTCTTAGSIVVNPTNGSVVTTNVATHTESSRSGIGMVGIYCVIVTANLSASSVPFYLATVPGQLIGNAVAGSATKEEGTGYSYDDTPSSSDPVWTKRITFGPPCQGGPAGNGRIGFFDLDLGQNYNSSGNPSWFQSNIGVTLYEDGVEIESRLFDGQSGNNEEDYFPRLNESPINYVRGRTYTVEVSNLNGVNAIKIALPFSQYDAGRDCEVGLPIATIDSCKVENGVTVFYGWGYDSDSGNEPTVAVDIYNVPNNGATTHSRQGSATLGGYRVTAINSALNNPSGPAGDSAYGFRIEIPGLTTGNLYYVDGNVRDHPTGGWSQVGINNFKNPEDVDNGVPFDAIPNNYRFDNGNIYTNPDRPTIPQACLTSSNTSPVGNIDLVCDIQPGTVNATIRVNRNTVSDPDGDIMFMTGSLTGGDGTTRDIDSDSGVAGNQSQYFGNNWVTVWTFNVGRSANTYTFTGTVNDQNGAVLVGGVTDTSDCPIPVAPSVTISGNCTNLSYQITGGEAFDYTVTLVVNGAPQANPSPHTNRRVGNGDNFSIGDWRDFNANDFSVNVSNQSYPSIAPGTPPASLSPGACLVFSCSINTNPGDIEVSSRYSVITRFHVYNAGTTVDATVGSRGNVPIINDLYTLSPSPTRITVSPPARPGSITASFVVTAGDFTAPAGADSYDTQTFIVTNNANTTKDCIDSTEVGQYPYVQFFNGDVISGYGITDADTAVCDVQDSVIEANIGVSAVDSSIIVGSGTQMAVFARGAVTGFRSAITQNTPIASANTTPWTRIFANSQAPSTPLTPANASTAGQLGGELDANMCAENWFADIPTALTPSPGSSVADSINISNNLAENLVGYNGDTRFSYNISNLPDQVFSGNKKIFVEGNIIIGGGVDGAVNYRLNDTGWTSVNDIPSVIFVARGNIYIDDNITRLDGVFVAGGSIYTCIPTASINPGITPESNYSQYGVGGTCNTIPLTVNGAFVANDVKLWRTLGSTNQATGYQDFASTTTAAERFRLSPEAFISRRFGEPPANGNGGNKKLDSLISLPPVY